MAKRIESAPGMDDLHTKSERQGFTGHERETGRIHKLISEDENTLSIKGQSAKAIQIFCIMYQVKDLAAEVFSFAIEKTRQTFPDFSGFPSL